MPITTRRIIFMRPSSSSREPSTQKSSSLEEMI
jgi:hypothetical protein